MQNKLYAKLIHALKLPVFPTPVIPVLLIGLALLPALVYLIVSVSGARQMAVELHFVPITLGVTLSGATGLAIGWMLLKLLERHLLVPFDRLKLAHLELSLHDPLTGLPNRRLLQDRIGQAMSASTRSGKRAALLFVDLDQFKNLNQTFGDEVGDLVLQQAALRMKSSVRACDTVARLAGDRFVIVLEDLSVSADEATEQSKVVGAKLLQALSQSYRHMLYECGCTASIGVTLFKGRQSKLDELLKQSETALTQAKAAGRNTLCVYAPRAGEEKRS